MRMTTETNDPIPNDPGPIPRAERPERVQLHIWVDQPLAEWVREQAHQGRISRGKFVEAILLTEHLADLLRSRTAP